MKKEWYDLWFCSLPGVGNVRGEKLLSLCGRSAKKLYFAPDTLWRQVLSQTAYEKVKIFTKGWRLAQEYERMVLAGIHLVTLDCAEYPERLRHIPDAPLGLFYKGKLPEKETPAVAVIGARECSPYGKYVAQELGKTLGERGIALISGMARGIDGISQEAALNAGGASFGVLGCGVDICYPAGNRVLYEKLLRQGGALSPYPPGTPPKAGHFPPRNRIVSGLSDAVVVIEARNKSGTLITVDMALEQGREVYVVPGRVTDRLSDGCNSLLKQGARVFLSPEEFVEELYGENMLLRPERRKMNACGKPEANSCKEALEEAVLNILTLTPQSVEEIGAKLPLPCSVGELSGIMMTLCIGGRAGQAGPGYFVTASGIHLQKK